MPETACQERIRYARVGMDACKLTDAVGPEDPQEVLGIFSRIATSQRQGGAGSTEYSVVGSSEWVTGYVPRVVGTQYLVLAGFVMTALGMPSLLVYS